MSAPLSNMDSILLAIPMIGLLFVGFFRLDEIFGKSRKPPAQRRTVAGTDDRGRQVCLDPDGTVVPIDAYAAKRKVRSGK